VRTIKQKKQEQDPELTRVNINIPTSLHRQFKSVTAAEGTDMTRVLEAYIREYVEKRSPTSKQPKGRSK
jgi:metal-responsive CopG/Arc/MetJ family transcriptional regulator